MCHGPEGKGNGVLVPHFQKFQQQPPRDLSQPQTRDRSEGHIWWIIGNGLGNMPAFKALLTEEERWLLTHFVREIQ
jgi:mono/diheme cytochrome c family protein